MTDTTPAATAPPPRLSVVVPLFNEQENVTELYRRLTASLRKIGLSFELVLVNDGSTDATPVMLDAIAARDPRVVALHLSRNFGHQAAVSCGLDHARGHAVVVMDGDLQDPPEVVEQFVRRWQEGYDVVYAVRTKRKESLVKRCGYFLFYRILRVISDLDIPLDSGDFCLLDRRVVESLKALPERMRFVRGLRTFVGFRQTGLRYERAAREAGKPKYTFRTLFRLALDGLFSFSSFPLSVVSWLGLFSVGVTLSLAVWVLATALAGRPVPPGWSSTMIAVLFMGSVQLLCLGVIGEYVRRIFVEVKGRPTYLVARQVRQQPLAESTPADSRDVA